MLSTRQGIFLPVRRKNLIIFFNQPSQDFKQSDQHPRYDARLAADWLIEITNSNILNFLPGQTLQAATCLVLPSASQKKIQVKLIDMKKEWQRGKAEIISNQVI